MRTYAFQNPRRGRKGSMWNKLVSEPGADRGPHAGSPRGVVDATGSSLISRSHANFNHQVESSYGFTRPT